MSELDVKLTSEVPRPEEGKTYTITASEVFQSQVRGFPGIRVAMKDSEGNEVVEVLWRRPVVGPRSKLGSFIEVLGKNPATWTGKKIKFTKWAERDRKIELVE